MNENCYCDICNSGKDVEEMAIAISSSKSTDRISICFDCFFAAPQEYECKACDKLFSHTGIPAKCPYCQSWNIWHPEWSAVNTKIQERQLKILAQYECMPLQTTGLLLQYKATEERFSNKLISGAGIPRLTPQTAHRKEGISLSE